MPDYKEMYFKVAGTLADAIEALDKLSDILKAALRDKEKLFVGDGYITEE